MKRKVAVVIGDRRGGSVVAGVQHTRRHCYPAAAGWGQFLDDATAALKMRVRSLQRGQWFLFSRVRLQKAARSAFVLHGVKGKCNRF